MGSYSYDNRFFKEVTEAESDEIFFFIFNMIIIAIELNTKVLD
jgi:hypothetical protein